MHYISTPFLTRRIFFLLLLFSTTTLFGQNALISGFVLEKKSGEALIGASVVLLQLPDSNMVTGSTSDIDGSFLLTNVKTGSYLIKTSYLGYATVELPVTVATSNIKDLKIEMEEDAQMLDEIKIEGITPRMTVQGDTVQFNAEAYKVNPDASAEDLITKMAGVTVENGKVQAQGEEVKRVLLDGKEFFGQDAVTALKNLQADMVDKVQVFDRMSEQSQFTGFNDGNTEKTINIITKPAMSTGLFGRVYGGYGTDDRFSGGGNVNYFEKKRRISLVGLSNNINQQNFSGEDLSGVAATGGGASGPRRGPPRNDAFSATENLTVGQANGISTSNAIGFNYDDEWGKKVKITSSYFFNTSKNENLSLVERQSFPGNSNEQLYDENFNSDTRNFNHRIAGRIEYTIDSNNTLLFIPRLSFQNTNRSTATNGITSILNGELLSRTSNENFSDSRAMNLSNVLIYRHRFQKKGRTITLNLDTRYNDRFADENLIADNRFFLQDSIALFDQLTDIASKSFTATAEVSYTEPIGEKSQLQFNYSPSVTRSSSERLANRLDDISGEYSITDTLLSNTFDNTLQYQKAGVTYRYAKEKYNFNIGLNYQFTTLNSDRTFPSESSIDKTFNNLLPVAIFGYNFSRTSNLRIFYRTFVRAPNVNQLQDVLDNTNPLFLRAGNKDLDQQYTHFIGMRFRNAKIAKGRNSFAFLGTGITQKYITNSTFIANSDTTLPGNIFLPAGGQLTRPINTNGFWNIRSFYSYGLPLLFIKSNLNLNGGFTYTRTPAIINEQNNDANTYNLNTGVVLGSNISPKVDFRITYTANYNIVRYSIQDQFDNNFYTGLAGASVTVLPWKGLVLNTDINYSHFAGLGDNFNNNFALWNAAIGYKFLKNQAAELRVIAFDLLQTNNSIARNVTETYVEDTQTNVIGRYFMLQFSYKFNKFPKAKAGGEKG
jgi:hypothetical protein